MAPLAAWPGGSCSVVIINRYTQPLYPLCEHQSSASVHGFMLLAICSCSFDPR